MKLIKKAICITLAMSMSLGLVACGGNDDKDSAKGGAQNTQSKVEAAKDEMADCTYREDSSFSLSGIVGDTNKFVATKDNIYIVANETAAATASDADAEFDGIQLGEGVVSRLYKVPLSGGSAEQLFESGEDDASFISNLGVGYDGSALAVICDGDSYMLMKLEDGGAKDLGDITKLVEFDDNNLDYLFSDKDGNIVIGYEGMSSAIKVFDSSLTEKSSCKSEDTILSAGLDANGDVVVATVEYGEDYTDATLSVRKLDVNTGSLSDKHSIDVSDITYGTHLMQGDGGYDFFFVSGSSVYGYNFEGEKTKKVVDYISSNVNGGGVDSCWMAGLKSFVISEFDANTYDMLPGVRKFDKVDPSEVANKKIMTLATIYGGSSLTQAAIDFNNSQNDTMIEIIDYSESSDPEGKFSADIASGVKPDFYDVSHAMGGMSISQYISKGMVEDLTPYLEKDSDISSSDIIPSAYDAMLDDGKLYFVASSMLIYTVVGKSSEIGAEPGWTYGEFKDYVTSKPEGTRVFESTNKMDTLDCFSGVVCKDFVDWKEGKCNFDSQEFKDLLEACNIGSNEEMDWAADDADENMIKTGKQLFVQGSLSADGLSMDRQMFGDDASYKGYPSKDKTGGRFAFQTQIAMSTECSDKDAGWTFLKYLMSEEYQGKILPGLYGAVPIRNDVFEVYLERLSATKEGTDKYGNKIEVRDNEIGWGDFTYMYKPLTKDETDAFREVVDKSKGRWESDEKVWEIVKEEAMAYFAGDKSVDDTCKIIQDRVNTYVNESK